MVMARKLRNWFPRDGACSTHGAAGVPTSPAMGKGCPATSPTAISLGVGASMVLMAQLVEEAATGEA